MGASTRHPVRHSRILKGETMGVPCFCSRCIGFGWLLNDWLVPREEGICVDDCTRHLRTMKVVESNYTCPDCDGIGFTWETQK